MVAAGLPQLVQTRAPDHQRRVQLQPVGPERRVLEKLLQETQIRVMALRHATLCLDALHVTFINTFRILSGLRVKDQNVETNPTRRRNKCCKRGIYD